MELAFVIVAGVLLTTSALSGCIASDAPTQPVTREIRFWVEPMELEVHPGVATAVWAFCAEGDGVSWVGDGPCSVPGPTIRVTEGDLVRITFENTHFIDHTVHFHGRHGFEADMNGATAIAPSMVAKAGATVEFEWVADPAGTFIYHCHFQTPVHMDMGMYGAFIVEERDIPRPDAEFVAVLDEWAIHDEATFVGGFPVYNFFTINGHSFPTTTPWLVQPGAHVRIHMVNAGFEFRAMHLHGYTPDSWEGVAGPKHAVPTDVRTVAPGQSVVLDFVADREGVWLFHDHVVPRVTAAGQDAGFGAYPRGMLTVLVVGDDAARALAAAAPGLLRAAAGDVADPGAAHSDHSHGDPAAEPQETQAGAGGVVVYMKDFAFQPWTIEVAPGTTVTWVNDDSAAHTVTFDDGSMDSGDIAPGVSWSYTFEGPGRIQYHCVPHSASDGQGARRGMVGAVVVTGA